MQAAPFCAMPEKDGECFRCVTAILHACIGFMTRVTIIFMLCVHTAHKPCMMLYQLASCVIHTYHVSHYNVTTKHYVPYIQQLFSTCSIISSLTLSLPLLFMTVSLHVIMYAYIMITQQVRGDLFLAKIYSIIPPNGLQWQVCFVDFSPAKKFQPHPIRPIDYTSILQARPFHRWLARSIWDCP